MRIKVALILLYMFAIISAKAQGQGVIENIVVYRSFGYGGTTTAISNVFKNPQNHSIDTTNINVGTDLFFNEFAMILAQSKQSKHFQQKIVDIEIAGEFWLNQSDKHFFVICLPDLVIDITDQREYKISNKILLKQMNDWIDNLKEKIH